MPIRTVFCGYDAPTNIGGPSRWLVRMLPKLAARGIEPHALWMIHPSHDLANPAHAPNATALRQAGIGSTVIHFPRYTGERVRWYLRQIDALSADVFVPNLCIGAYYAGRWCRPAGVPAIAVLRSDHAFYHDLCDAFVGGDPAYRVSACVGVSSYLTERAREAGLGAVRVARIPSGADVPPARAEPPGNEFRLIYSGRLVQEAKRILDLTATLCRVTQEVPGTRAVLHGKGIQEEEVRSLIEQHAAGDRVRLGGSLEPEELQRVLLRQHALVLLSDYEGMPNAVMEAMACGVVPICLEVRSGIGEILRDGENGLLVQDRGDGVVRAVRRLMDEPGLWQRLSDGARKTAEECFDSEVCADRWAELIRQLHDEAPPRRPVRIPLWLRLPPPRPGFALEDPRPPPLLIRCRRLLRSIIR